MNPNKRLRLASEKSPAGFDALNEEANKLSLLGTLATGVAHNINNPVGIIRLAAQRGLRRLEKGMSVAEGQDIFQDILTEADRLHTIIQGFRNFANGDRKQRETVALNALVEQVKDYFGNQLEAHHITLTLELSDQNPGSHTNRFVLQEVLMNLIGNAREALENIPDAFILIKTWQTAKKVGLQVEDNGAGIPQEQQQNLFSPFHSTKAHGTGLGLHFAHKALADIDGTITYQDRQPNGACFIIELPPLNGTAI
jgi:histidine kinase